MKNKDTYVIHIFRVECNHGTKLFETGLEAYRYFNKMQKQWRDTELWLVTYFKLSGRLIATQELIAH